MPDVSIVRVEASQLYDLRRRVLRGNDPTADVSDPRDAHDDAGHFAATLAGEVVAGASFYRDASPVHPSVDAFQLRLVATDPRLQGQGIGRQLLEALMAEVRRRGAQELWANARDTALGFYVALGFTLVEGSESISPVTNLPHTIIFRTFTP